MPLTDKEIVFVGWVTGQNITASAVADGLEKQAKKEKFLTEVLSKNMSTAREEIDKAQALVIHKTDNPNALVGAWRKMTKTEDAGKFDMKWRATDDDVNKGLFDSNQLRADVEVDTAADIDEDTANIDIGDIQALQQSFERIKEMERAMLAELDKNGEPIFTEADIRRELWTPLVKSGLIPENMVPDGFSEQAIAFKEAKALYEDKIAEYTETHSKTQETLQDAFRIGKEVVKVVGAVVANSITIANAPAIAGQNAELAKLGKVDPEPTAAIQAAKDEISRLEAMSTYAETAITLVSGTISGLEIVADHHYAPKDQPPFDKWMTTISKGIELAQKMSISAAGSAFAREEDKNLSKCVTSAMSAGFTAARLVPSLALVIREPDETKRAKLIAGVVNDFASAVSDSINAVASQIKPATNDDAGKAAAKEQQAAFGAMAAALKSAIIMSGKAPAIIKAYETGDRAALGLLLGGAAVQTILNGSAAALYDVIRKDVSDNELGAMSDPQAQFAESNTDKTSQRTALADGTATSIEGITASIVALDSTVMDSLRKGPVPNMTPEQLEAFAAASVMEGQKAATEKELAKVMSKEGIEAMMNDAEAELAAFDEMYAKAYPDTGLGQRAPLEVTEALKSIDRAMAATAALRQRVAIINGISSGAAGLLAAIVPGTGAVASAQKLAYDIYLLVKAVEKHNVWVESMQISLAGQSGVSAAIENTLRNATIQLSQKSITVILDSLKVSAEVARVFDPTGAATGVSAGASMAQALTDFGYAMHTEVEIRRGWTAFVDARANPKNRKAARKALRLNSTLAKCCIAYGATIMDDTAAKAAVKATGLSIAVLQDDQDICNKLINYLETELSEDPTVLRVDYKKDTDWFPRQPKLDFATWTLFKSAASKSALPRLSPDSIATPGIDRLLIEIGSRDYWSDPTGFSVACKAVMKIDENGASTAEVDKAKRDALVAYLLSTQNILNRIDAAYKEYSPKREDLPSSKHESMIEVALTFATLSRGWNASVTAQIDKVPN